MRREMTAQSTQSDNIPCPKCGKPNPQWRSECENCKTLLRIPPEKDMTTPPDNQKTQSDSHMLLWATWLWILAGTVSIGMIWGRASIPADGYATPGVFAIPFTIGGMIGGIVARFLPRVHKWGKPVQVLSLILPILIIIPIVSQVVELGALLFLSIFGVLGSAYVLWIPRWISRLREKTKWVVDVAVALMILNTCFILAMGLLFGTN
jgi:hypothetical protein